MRSKFLLNSSAIAITSLLSICIASSPALAVQGDPIPGVDVSVEQSPSGIIIAPASLYSLKEGYSATASIAFNAGGDANGTVSVTFPSGYNVSAAATSEASSRCLSSFNFTATTLTAKKTNCEGMIILGGAIVNTPAVGYASPTTVTYSTPQPTQTVSTNPVVDTKQEASQNYNSSKSNTAGIIAAAKQCTLDANKAHDLALRTTANTQASDIKAARKAYNDAIKAAQNAYQVALKKIATDTKTARTRIDVSWKETKNSCTVAK